MRKIMAVNAGSSSLKFQLLEMPAEKLIVSGLVERIKTEQGHYVFKVNGEKVIDRSLPIMDHAKAVELVLEGLIEKHFVESLDEISGVGHRIVQGGPYFSGSCLVTPEVKEKIRELIPLAPLHNGPHLVGIEAFEKVLPGVPNVVVFDTAFHQTMPEECFLYGTPYEWYTDYKVRKYGAHGTSHQYVAGELARLAGKDIKDLKIITCHLGNGASLTAVKDGKCLDTSMGLTPLDGFPMGTRSGNMDPTVLSYMADKKGYTLKELIYILNNESGYKGISGFSHDSRDLDDAIEKAKNPKATPEEKERGRRAWTALNLQYKRIADYIGSYYVLMGGVDAIVFTAGIGENSPLCRSEICKRVKVLGVEIDEELNKKIHGDVCKLSTDKSKVLVYVIPTNEELVIARDVMRLTK